MAKNNKQQTSGWVGWIGFASVMMLVAGIFQMIKGFTSLFRDDVLVTVGNGEAWIFDASTWGWVLIAWGALLMFASNSLSQGHAFGRLFTMFLAIGGMAINMIYLPLAPVWSVITIAVYFFVLYAVVIHADEIEER